MEHPEEDEFDFDDFIASETPFDPKEGIWFRYGRIFLDAPRQIADFESFLGVKLPGDFLGLIGENCIGGFDGWYQVLKDDSGSLVWMHLLLMKLPDSVDLESDEALGQEGASYITTKILDSRRELFFEDKQLAYLPFGAASRMQSDGSGIEGYLAFDINKQYRVVFIHDEKIEPTPVANSFSNMMAGAVFQFFG